LTVTSSSRGRVQLSNGELPVFKRTGLNEPAPIQAKVGHWTNGEAQTGCTVILFDRPAPAVVDVRGGAPGTRETDLLAPGRLVRSVDAILLTGGSAFGLAAADGVMRYLQEQGRGVATPAGPVPIVPTAVIYDLAVGRATAPDAESGRRACLAAVPIADLRRGKVGAGTGATTGKIYRTAIRRGGFGMATVTLAIGTVTALVVVNAVGAVVGAETGIDVLSGDADRRSELLDGLIEVGIHEATTLGVVLVNAPVDESALVRCAVSAHDAFARCIRPCHTIFDGDLVFAVGLAGGAPPPSDVLRVTTATELALEQAVIDAVVA
jgi:L-aminopeptidase/D-esterase-like protein